MSTLSALTLPLEVSLYQDYEYPMVSVILLTWNSAQSLHQTLDSILSQDYPLYELIVVDAGSTDRTLEIIKEFQSEKIHLHTVSVYQWYEMLNKGISQANGTYICIMFPGDFYLSPFTYKKMMEKALEHNLPHMLYCGTLLRDTRTDVQTILRPFSKKILRSGHQPTSLQACWFHRKIFALIGKFDDSYQMRGGFEFMCRVITQRSLRTVFVRCVLIDSEIRVTTKQEITLHFLENGRAIWHHFGWMTFLFWLFTQGDTKRLFYLWLRGIKLALLGK